MKAPRLTPDTSGHIHMVLGITQETSETSAQNKMQLPSQALSHEGTIFGDAGQFKVFCVAGGDEDNDDDDGGLCSQIKPLCGYPVMTQWESLKLKNKLRIEKRRISDIFSSLRRYECIFTLNGHDDLRIELTACNME